MAQQDKRMDAYIEKAEEFAQPILNYLRTIIHEVCPEVTETIKWGMPHFEYAGSILCGMASFKNHCAFGFWLGSIMKDPHKVMSGGEGKTGMGHFGQIKTIRDLPSKKILVEYLRQAMALNEQGVKRPKTVALSTKKELEIPEYFQKVLSKNKKAQAVFEKFSYSHKKEYVEWITEAKTEQTKNRRMATAVEWLKDGKGLNWKYN